MSPDIGKLRPIIDEGDRAFARAAGKLPPAMEGRAARARASPGSSSATSDRPAAGDLPRHRLAAGRVDLDRRRSIVFTGGLIAHVAGARRGAGARAPRYAARLARDLGRAA